MTLHPATLAAAVVVDELVAAGTTDVVICPGSRSTPLAYAFAHAEQQGQLRVHMRSDERTAAFVALGMARATGKVTPIVMTSGSAVTHCFPAVVEASLSGIPLLVVSANRPWTWWGSGASQTIDQPHLFGRYVTRYEGIDATTTPTPARLRAAVDRVIHAASGATPTGHRIPAGPAHIDIAFDAPLVPRDLDALAEAAQWARSTGREGIYTRVVEHEHIDSPRLLHIAGDGGANLGMVPTLAEPTAARPDMGLNPLIAAEVDPTHVVVTGRPTLHRPVMQLLARTDIPITVCSPTAGGPTGAWDAPDPFATARTIAGQVSLNAAGIDPAWVGRLTLLSDQADRRVRAAVDAEDPQAMTGLSVAAAVASQLRRGDTLLVGASTPIRDFSLLTWPAGVRVLSNRGAAGIDGFLSTAIGHALCTPGATLALAGDLTFLHDLTALTPTDTPWPTNLVIVVANDGGGAIFETLEPGSPALRPHFEKLIATAHRSNLEQLCTGMGVGYRRATTRQEVAEALEQHRRSGGLWVVEACCQRATRRSLAEELEGN